MKRHGMAPSRPPNSSASGNASQKARARSALCGYHGLRAGTLPSCLLDNATRGLARTAIMIRIYIDTSAAVRLQGQGWRWFADRALASRRACGVGRRLRASRNCCRSGHSAAVTTTSALMQLWPALCARPVATWWRQQLLRTFSGWIHCSSFKQCAVTVHGCDHVTASAPVRPGTRCQHRSSCRLGR